MDPRRATWLRIVLYVVALVFIGAMIARQSRIVRGGAESAGGSGRVNAAALVRHVDREVRGPAFARGDAVAIMGSVTLDLRDARIEGEEAVVNLRVVMGRAILRVPAEWHVVQDIVPVMGSVDVDREAPAAEPRQRLRVRGLVLMGSVDIDRVAEKR